MKRMYLLLAMCLIGVTNAFAYLEIYTEFNESTGVLTYYVDELRTSRSGKTELWDYDNYGEVKPRWEGYNDKIKKIVIDKSVRDNQPSSLKSIKGMFYSGVWNRPLSAMTEIEGLRYLETQDVKDMSYLFCGCTALKKIKFQLSTNSLQDMSYMFARCESLEEVDLGNITTLNVTNMSYLFDECYALKEIDLTLFRTSRVTDMSSMFCDCHSLKTINVAGFDMRNVTSISGMFTNCVNLETIYCNTDWTVIGMDADDLFYYCMKLKGGNGTSYDEDHTYLDYARPDLNDKKQGYFTIVDESYAFYVSSSKELVFMHDALRQFTGENGYLLPIMFDTQEETEDFSSKVKKVSIYSTFKNSPLDKSMCAFPVWTPSKGRISGYTNATEINGLANINTEVMTDLQYVCTWMNSLREIDLTGVDFTPVHTPLDFAYCSSLTTIYCNVDWNTLPNCKWASFSAFLGCESLVGGKGTSFAEVQQTSIAYAHPDGGMDNPGYFTSTIQTYAVYDEDISTLTYYHDGLRSTYSVTYSIPWESEEKFNEVKNYVGRIVIDPSFHDAPLKSAKDVFHFQTNPKILAFDHLGEIEGIEHINTEVMTDLSYLFYGMGYVDKLDLTKMNLKPVNRITHMFSLCSNLTTILCDEDLSAVQPNATMFRSCVKLVGGRGTVCDGIDNIDASMARPDEKGKPGYFTSTKTAIDHVRDNRKQGAKILRDGLLFIEKNERLFNVQGAELK